MLGIILQAVSIIVLHDYNPALTPGLMEDSALFAPAYAVMNLLELWATCTTGTLFDAINPLFDQAIAHCQTN